MRHHLTGVDFVQEWTNQHGVARVDIAGVDNAGVVKSAVAANASRRCHRQDRRGFTGIIIS